MESKSSTIDRTRDAAATGRRIVVMLAALAQETRLAIFKLLVEFCPDGLTPSALAMRLGLAPATLSFHLKELANAGLVTDRRAGRFIWYCADIDAMNALVGHLTEHCCRSTRDGCGTPACAPASGAASSRTRRSP